LASVPLHWQKFEWWGREQQFKRTGHAGPLASLVASALDGAVAATRNVTIAQTAEDPETASPGALLMAFMRVRPVTLICPERPLPPGANTRWAMAWLTGDARRAQPQFLAESAIQGAVNALAKEQFPPFNQAQSLYAVPSLLLRHDGTVELTYPDEYSLCKACDGVGHRGEKRCLDCRGSGWRYIRARI